MKAIGTLLTLAVIVLLLAFLYATLMSGAGLETTSDAYQIMSAIANQ